MKTIIDSLFKETKDIVSKLEETGEISFASDANKHFTKIFVLSTASYFEEKIKDIIIEYFDKHTSQNDRILSFVKKKAISLQYHTYFKWGEINNLEKSKNNANSFFSLFGQSFKKEIDAIIKKDEKLEESVKCFLELGHSRNILVHSNFAAYSNITKTIDEYYDVYKKALDFVSFFEEHLNMEESSNE